MGNITNVQSILEKGVTTYYLKQADTLALWKQ